MESNVGRVPEYLFLDGELTTDDVRRLLEELAVVGVSQRTGVLFAELAVTPPAARLGRNLGVLAGILSERSVAVVLEDGLLLDERNALLELEIQGVTQDSRATSHALLNVKERWIMVKTLSGVFGAARGTEGGFIPLDA